MTEIVINASHLQTWRQRLGGSLLNLFGWLLWCYFLFPLLSLACWLLGYPECSQWVLMSGGYFDFQGVLLIYLETVATLVSVWLLWLVYRFTQKNHRSPTPPILPVSREALCDSFNVAPQELQACLGSRLAVVHFDRQGHIIGLECCKLPAQSNQAPLETLSQQGIP